MKKPKSKAEDELELKIELSAQDFAKILDHFSASAKKQGQTINTKSSQRKYYDTAELDLHKNHISWRIQPKAGRYKQTIKYEIKPDDGRVLDKGEVLRRECSDIIKKDKPDHAHISDAGAHAAVQPFEDLKKIHIGTAKINRVYFNLLAGNGESQGTVEMAFDLGHLRVPKTTQRFAAAKIELELKGGSHQALYALKAEIFNLAPSAQIDPYISKADELATLYIKHALK